jgi:hypothetical protein
MAANINVTTGITIQAVDITANVTPFTRQLSGILLPVTVWAASDFFQVTVGGVTISLPATTIFYTYVRNLGANNITITYTPTGGSSTSFVLPPVTSNFGGIWLYGCTAETAGGITALSAAAATATTPIEYFVAA